MKTEPKNVVELIESEWYSKVKQAINKFHLREDNEDTMQDILTELMEKNYLIRWDETKSSFSTWLYTFVNNRLKKKWNHEHCQAETKLSQAIRLDRDMDETTVGVLFADTRVDYNHDAEMLVETIENVLSDARFAASSSNKYEGKVYQRDMKTVFHFLVEGKDVAEMATIFGTSPQFVYGLVRKLKKECLSLV